MHPIYTGTWGTKISIASWDYSVHKGESRVRTENLAVIKEFLIQLRCFAELGRVSFNSRSLGEDYFEIEYLGSDLKVFESCYLNDDIELINIELNIKCLGLDNQEHLIENGASISVFVEQEQRYQSLNIVFELNADIYFEYTRVAKSNNELSKLNIPRLALVLRKLSGLAGLKLVEFEVPGYTNLVKSDGLIDETKGGTTNGLSH